MTLCVQASPVGWVAMLMDGQVSGLTGSEGYGLTGLLAKQSDGCMAAKWPGLCSGQSGHIGGQSCGLDGHVDGWPVIRSH